MKQRLTQKTILTIDRMVDPGKITKYVIKNNMTGKESARGYYLHVFGIRFGLHRDSKQMRLVA